MVAHGRLFDDVGLYSVNLRDPQVSVQHLIDSATTHAVPGGVARIYIYIHLYSPKL